MPTALRAVRSYATKVSLVKLEPPNSRFETKVLNQLSTDTDHSRKYLNINQLWWSYFFTIWVYLFFIWNFWLCIGNIDILKKVKFYFASKTTYFQVFRDYLTSFSGVNVIYNIDMIFVG